MISARAARRALALFGATACRSIVAIVGIGMDRGAITSHVGASLIGAGMVSVLVYPLLAGAISGAEEWSPETVASTEAEY